MIKAITGVDHVFLLVRDLDAARARMERLGFTVSPRGLHSPQMGTANHTIMLAEDYFELLGIVTPTALNLRRRQELARYQGLHAIALRTPDARKAWAELRAAGIAAADPVRFSRPVELQDGGRREAVFTVTVIPEEAAPAVEMFVCEHHTRELVWLPQLTGHPNSAVGLASITVVVADPGSVIEPYRRLFGAARVAAGKAEVTVRFGTCPVSFVAPAALAERFRGIELGKVAPPMMVGLGIAVRDLATARACLGEASIEATAVDGGLRVGPAAACGVVLDFRRAGNR